MSQIAVQKIGKEILRPVKCHKCWNTRLEDLQSHRLSPNVWECANIQACARRARTQGPSAELRRLEIQEQGAAA